jgi:carboxyl-terminal processing protease
MKRARGWLLLVLCAASCARLVGPDAQRDPGSVFDSVWHEFDRHYAFFDPGGINWDSLGAAYRHLAVAARSDDELARTLGGLLYWLHDAHVVLHAGGDTFSSPVPSDTVADYFDLGLILRKYVLYWRFSSGRHVIYGMATSSVGYVRISSFAGNAWSPEIDDVLAALPDATGLVVDIRDNNGGDGLLARDLAGRFAVRRTTYAYERFRDGPAHSDFTDYIPLEVSPSGVRPYNGPVVVLINRHVYSAAEEFALAMMATPSVTTVGDTTGGVLGGLLERELPNGWTYQLSQSIRYSIDRHPFRGVGVVPAIALAFTVSDSERGVDPQLELAISLVR